MMKTPTVQSGQLSGNQAARFRAGYTPAILDSYFHYDPWYHSPDAFTPSQNKPWLLRQLLRVQNKVRGFVDHIVDKIESFYSRKNSDVRHLAHSMLGGFDKPAKPTRNSVYPTASWQA